MNEVAVVGVGLHPFGKFEDKPLREMTRDAVNMALADAGLAWSDVEAVAAGSSHFSGGMGWGLSGNEILYDMGATGLPVYNLSAACATGAGAFNVAHMMVAGGQHDVVLVVGGEKMPKGFIPRPPGSADDISDSDYLRWTCVGCPNTAYWALECRRRMEDRGTTERDLAVVAAKAHNIGVENPNARFRKPLSIEDVMASPMVSYPLRLQEICAVSDGAAAVVVCSGRLAREAGRRPVWVAASAVATAQYGDVAICTPDLTASAVPRVPRASEVTCAVSKALASAGVHPTEVDLIELQDNCVWQELEYPEIWGVFEPGQGEWMANHGQTGIAGSKPINPSGGFLSFGEATTVMGLFQVFEMTAQLRGEAGSRQTSDPKVALGQTRGLGGNGAAIVLKR
jgi:acetyl-CoA acetyltransferase